MAEDKEILSLDLDSEDFKKGMQGAIGLLAKLGDGSGLKGTLAGLSDLAKGTVLITGAIGAAGLAMKTVFAGEEIEQTSLAFEQLAKSAGLVPDTLKEGMIEASEGVLSATDAMELANKAIVKLGGSADKIPEIMALAEKASKVTGESIENTFEQLTQGIATGNQRTLKQMGIIVDTDQAVRNYAKSVGVAVSSLNEQAKIQAVANAALAKGQEVYGNINVDVDQATKSYERFMASLNNLKDLLIVVFERTVGPILAKTMNVLREGIDGVTVALTARFGKGTDAAAANIKILQSQLDALNFQLAEIEKGPKEQRIGGFLIDMGGVADETRAKIAALQAQLEQAKANLESQRGPAGKPEQDLVDVEKQKALQAQLNAELLKLREQNLADEMRLAQTEEDVIRIHAAQKQTIEEDFANKRAQLLAEGELKNIDVSQKILLIEQQKNLKLEEMDKQLWAEKSQALDNYLNKSQYTANAFAKAFEVATRKAQVESSNFATLGKKSFDSFSTNAVTALLAIGDGSKDAGEAMKGFMLNSLADIAQAQGSVMLASVLANPALGVAGAALIVLAGFLRSQAGGKGTGASIPTTVSGASPGSAEGFGTRPETANAVYTPQQKKSVSINIQGNYFETDQTRTRMMEIIRESSDYTDFTLKSIGNGS